MNDIIVGIAHLTREMTPAELRKFHDEWNMLIVRTNNPDPSGQHPPTGCLINSDTLVAHDGSYGDVRNAVMILENP